MIPTSRWARAAICVAAGVLLALSCPDIDVWPLTWIGFVPMLWVALDEKVDSPFTYGWITGLVAMGGTFYWINGLLQRFGHLPLVASAPIFLLLIGYQSIVFGLLAWVTRRLRDHLHLPVALLAPVAVTAIELLMPQVFPWYFAICQAWVRPVIQIADLTGPLGVTFLLLLVNGAIYDTVVVLLRREKPSWRPAAAAVAVMAAVLVYGQVRIHQVEARRAAALKAKVGVVQANIGIHEKFVPGLAEEQLKVHQRLSADLVQQGADLLVWPESSYPYVIGRDRTSDFGENDRRRVMEGFARPLMFGTLTRGRESPYPFNSALMMDADGTIRGRFDKNFLLVFGEYIPFYEHVPWFQQYIPAASNFARGDTVTTFPLEVGGKPYTIGPMICYEDIIPSFGRRLVAQRPNLLVNITNDAWFGETSEPWEHLALSVFRSVEHRLDLVRAVNTGVSAFVDATGRVYKTGPAIDPALHPGVAPEALLDEVALLEASGPYGTLGDLFGGLALIALIALALAALRRAGRAFAWRPLGLGVGSLALLTGAGALLLVGPSRMGQALAVLARVPGQAGEDAFTIGLRLVVATGIAALVTGVLLARVWRPAPRVEGAAAAFGAAILPTVLFGRVEGETASLAFTALGAVALVLLGMRLGSGRPARVRRGRA